jgi:RNA polymerase sigma-70 factor (ECF subfamily)
MNVADRSGALVAAAKLGDRVAFSDLITDEYPVAFKLAFALLHDPNEAEDAVQEAAFKAWRHIDQFRVDAAFRPWLLGIVANQCRTAARGRWWSVIRSSEVRPAAATMSVDELASLELRAALRRLSYDQRLILILRYYVDLSYEEIAAQFQISTKAARSRAERALKRLRPLVSAQGVIA